MLLGNRDLDVDVLGDGDDPASAAVPEVTSISSAASRQRYRVIDIHSLQGVQGHRRKLRVLGILHDRDAAESLDGPQSGRAVVEIAGQGMTPTAAGPKTCAAERNSGSIAGLKLCSRGPFVTRTWPGSTSR